MISDIRLLLTVLAIGLLPLCGCQQPSAPAAAARQPSDSDPADTSPAASPAPLDQAPVEPTAAAEQSPEAPATGPTEERPVENDARQNTSESDNDGAGQVALVDEKEEAAPAKAPAGDGSGEITDYSFDDIKFEMEKTERFKRSMLTPKIEAMNGKRIRIRGYILPSFQQTGLTQFVLVRDNMECCFGPGAALYDCILVEMDEGTSTNFSVRPVAVEGIFSIREFLGPDRKHLAVYHLQANVVK